MKNIFNYAIYCKQKSTDICTHNILFIYIQVSYMYNRNKLEI